MTHAAAKTHLQAQLRELQQRLIGLKTQLAEPLDADSAEQAVELQDDASIEAQAALVSHEIGSVERALERLAEGSYGDCVRCGAPISLQRLQARPEAALCIECAQHQPSAETP